MIITLFLWGLGLTAIAAVIVTIIKEIDGSIGRGKAKKTLENVLVEHKIVDYYWEQFEDGQILLHDRTYGSFYVIGSNGGAIGMWYTNILNVELVIDDSVAYQSSLTSATGRAIVGDVLAGRVGAIIGGVTGKKNSRKVVHRVEMILSFNSSDYPYSKITLLDSQQGEEISGYAYETAYAKGLQWSRRVSALLK
ncbi:hypothetical protein [Sporosarcina sp. FSL K6-5500]|uniref:hypothetical protein n=1 Tax=Sporosarcina sp. FSL K6-5500 TaxID=2921558 RepID=UPI0030F4E956